MQLSKIFLSETTRPRAFTVTFELFSQVSDPGPYWPSCLKVRSIFLIDWLVYYSDTISTIFLEVFMFFS